METIKLLVIALVRFVSSCEQTAHSMQTDAAAPLTIAASQVTYDSTKSGLNATHVQAAIDLLASKSAESPIAPRLELVQTQVPASNSTAVAVTALCPDQAHDVVLGGDCFAGGMATLVATQILLVAPDQPGGPKAGFVCTFSQPSNNPSPTIGSAICLRNARGS